MSHKKYFLILSIAFLILFLMLSVSPYDRADWALENALVIVFAIIMVLSYRKFPLSRISYTLIFLFMCLHEIGSHYTYALVPYDAFFISNFNFSLNEFLGWERNNFDRIVHFLYGLLLAYPIKELYCRVADASGFWSYFFPLELTMATSMMYELVEWAAAEIFGGDLGMAYLGTQGDIWDAHKDMGLASLGALVAMVITALINMYIQKDFREEWKLSLSVKSNVPLGEDEINRLLNEENSRIERD
jgi:putative membrane protein